MSERLAKYPALRAARDVMHVAASTSRRFFLLLISTPIVVGMVFFGVESAFAVLMPTALHAAGVQQIQRPEVLNFLGDVSATNIILLALAVGLLRATLSGIQVTSQAAGIETFRYIARKRMIESIQDRNVVNGDVVMSHFTEDVSRSGDALWWVTSSILAGIQAAMATITLMCISPLATVGLLGVVVVLYLPVRLVIKNRNERNGRASRLWEAACSSFSDLLRNHMMLRIYRAEGEEYEKVKIGIGAQVRDLITSHVFTGFYVFHPQAVGIVGICGVIFAVSRWDLMGAGSLLPYLYLLGRTSQNVSTISQNAGLLKAFSGNLDTVASYLRNSGTVAKLDEATVRAPESASRVQWTLAGVGFQYPGISRPILEDFSLTIVAGSFTLISGPSGVGKSTLLQILVGELQPTSGNVAVDIGEGFRGPLSGLKGELLGVIGYVGVGGALLRTSIRHNLLLGMKSLPSDAEIAKVLRECNCEFLDALPDGIDTVYRPEVIDFSTGQRQRLALARALLRKPKALLLDEATANLDDDAAAILAAQLRRLKGTVTIVAISHGSHFNDIADVHIRMRKAQDATLLAS